jgi:hypothetical protein
MKFTNIFYITIFNINTYLFLTENNNTIRFAFILSRTGSHSPSKLKNIDTKNAIYKDIFGYEWRGENELTNIGKRQQFYLGYQNSLKYKNILYSEIYHPKELLSISSECNKTIQSSYSQLHALYQNTNITLTNNQIKNAIPPLNSDKGYHDAKNELDKNKFILPNNIQIVPVHTFYEKDHNYLLEKVQNCPKIKKYYEEGDMISKKKIEEILNFKSENDKNYGEIILEILNEENIFNERYNIKNLSNNFTFFKLIAETFICDYFNGVNFNKFTQKGIDIYKLLQMFEGYFGEISIGGGVNNKFDERANKTYELSQKVNYDLFNSLLEWTKIRIENDIQKNFNVLLYESPKIVLYLSHHESIESLYYFMKETFNIKNAKNSLYTNFSSFIGIELYRKNNEKNEYTYKDFYIKFIYDNQQLGIDISYNEFYERIKERIISLIELEEYCGFNENLVALNSNSNSNQRLYGTILICFFPILTSFSIILFIKKKEKIFHPLPEEILNDNSNNIN